LRVDGKNPVGMSVAAEDKQGFVEELAREHGQRLHRFLVARLRQAASDVPDLVQEIYLRLLRIPNHQSIRSPRAYLFTVALHVLHQHKLTLAATPRAVDITDVLSELEARAADNPSVQLETDDALAAFDRMLQELPPLPHAVFVLHRKHGY